MFRPCIDLHQGKVKQIVGSTLVDGSTPTTNFVSEKSAAYFAELYKKDELKGGHVIMLGPGNEAAAFEALKAYPGSMQVGGGITPQNAKTFLDAGASHVIVTSFVFREGNIDFKRLEEIVKVVGKDKLVLDLSCRKNKSLIDNEEYFVVTDRWQKFTNFEVNKKNLDTMSKYCSEFLVHAVDVEGKQEGILADLVEKLGKWSSIPVTYAGGARTIRDLELVKKLGNGKVSLTIGSALDIFGGKLPYADVVKWHKETMAEH